MSGIIPGVGDIMMNKTYLLPTQTLHSRWKRPFWSENLILDHCIHSSWIIKYNETVIKTSYWFILDLVYMRVLQGKGCWWDIIVQIELLKQKRQPLMWEVTLLHSANYITLNLKPFLNTQYGLGPWTFRNCRSGGCSLLFYMFSWKRASLYISVGKYLLPSLWFS